MPKEKREEEAMNKYEKSMKLLKESMYSIERTKEAANLRQNLYRGDSNWTDSHNYRPKYSNNGWIDEKQ